MIIKKGTQVKIISGKDKGKTGEILEIKRSLNKIKVKSINMIKKHLKPTKENKGGIVSKENFIHQSNIKNIDLKKKEKKATGNKWYQDYLEWQAESLEVSLKEDAKISVS